MAVVDRLLRRLGYWRLSREEEDAVLSARLIARWPELGEAYVAKVAVDLMRQRFPEGGDFRTWGCCYPLVRHDVLARAGR